MKNKCAIWESRSGHGAASASDRHTLTCTSTSTSRSVPETQDSTQKTAHSLVCHSLNVPFFLNRNRINRRSLLPPHSARTFITVSSFPFSLLALSCSSDLLLKSPLQYVCCLIAPFFHSSACHPMLL